jgi:hypothetical protein
MRLNASFGLQVCFFLLHPPHRTHVRIKSYVCSTDVFSFLCRFPERAYDCSYARSAHYHLTPSTSHRPPPTSNHHHHHRQPRTSHASTSTHITITTTITMNQKKSPNDASKRIVWASGVFFFTSPTTPNTRTNNRTCVRLMFFFSFVGSLNACTIARTRVQPTTTSHRRPHTGHLQPPPPPPPSLTPTVFFLFINLFFYFLLGSIYVLRAT